MDQNKTLCFLCENKRFLFGTEPYLCLVTRNALYLVKKPRKLKTTRESGRTVLDLDRDAFLTLPGLKTYRGENVTDYRCFISYDESEPDFTPLDEASKYATIFFRERESGRRVTLRCLCDLEELRSLTDGIFAEEERFKDVAEAMSLPSRS